MFTSRARDQYKVRHRACHCRKNSPGQGVKLNITAIMTLAQVRDVVSHPQPRKCRPTCRSLPGASRTRRSIPYHVGSGGSHGDEPGRRGHLGEPRELLNIFQADAIGCHIITVTNDVLKKTALIGRNLDDYSLDTVNMFYKDATRPVASRSSSLSEYGGGCRHRVPSRQAVNVSAMNCGTILRVRAGPAPRHRSCHARATQRNAQTKK